MNYNEGKKIICPVDQSLQLFNKKWHIQIIRDLFFGKKRFKDFKEDKPNLSNKVLSNSLKELETNGLIEKKIIETSPITTEYSLTEEGRKMNKIIYEIAMFTLNKEDSYPSEEIRNNIKKTFQETLNIK